MVHAVRVLSAAYDYVPGPGPHPYVALPALPGGVELLPALEELHLRDMDVLGGSVPSVLTQLTGLTTIALGNGNLSKSIAGTLPPSWSALTGLRDLRLHGLNITGALRPCLAGGGGLVGCRSIKEAWLQQLTDASTEGAFVGGSATRVAGVGAGQAQGRH